MSPTNSIWRDATFLMKYIERCQKLLQWGKPDNDFLVYLPVRDMWKKNTDKLLMMFDINSMAKKAPEFMRAVMEIDSLGYGTDYVSDRQLAKTRKAAMNVMSDGTLHADSVLITEGGTEYKGLIDPRKPINSEELQRMAKPEELRSRLGLRYIRRTNPYGYHYFIANLTPNDIDDYVILTVPYQKALWYNPMTDEYTGTEQKDGKIRVSLLSGESRFLLLLGKEQKDTVRWFEPNGKAMVLHRNNPAKIINTPWTLRFTEEAPKVDRTWTLAHPQTWETLDDDSVRITMGTGIYTTSIRLNKAEAQKNWAIDLGDVRESARVYINGRFIGCAWAAPFILNTNGTLRKGKNEIRIEVTNLPANRIADMDRRGIPWRKMKEINVVDINYKKTTYDSWKPVKSGLNSEVKLVEY